MCTHMSYRSMALKLGSASKAFFAWCVTRLHITCALSGSSPVTLWRTTWRLQLRSGTHMMSAPKLRHLRLRDVTLRVSTFYYCVLTQWSCVSTDLLTSSKKRADYLKAKIRNKISELLGMWDSCLQTSLRDDVLCMLVGITGNPKAIMHYTWYEEEIIQWYGIKLQGWTYEEIINPSLLSSSLPPLKTLLDALTAGTCKFVKLSASERKEREAAYMEKIASGQVEVHKRKRRSDAGVSKSKRARIEDNAASGEVDGDNKEGVLCHPKSQEIIEDSNDE